MAEITQSTVLRQRVAKQNEDVVIAENAAQMERIVCWVRLATISLIAMSGRLSVQVLGVQRSAPDAHRRIALGLYVLFALSTLVGMYRAKPDARKAFKGELFFALADASFTTYMGIRTWEVQHVYRPGQGAALFALIICFAMGRVSVLQVAFSWALSCAGMALVAASAGAWSPQEGLFVMSCYTALALLVGMMQTRIRKMFVMLRKRDNLSRFLPPQVADEVMKSGDGQLQPVQREVTVLFSDIRDFTAFSENLPPGAVLAFLDEYFGHMAHLVKEHEGIVNKFLGDGMLAFWGVPQRNARHAELAVKAALDMRRVVEELNQARINNGAQPIRIGIGIHTGQVAAGMLGGADQHEYTVIGDAVNVASRVEGLTKQLGVDLLVSESTWRQLEGRFSGHRLDEQHVKGRQEAVIVYSVLDRLPRVNAA